METQYKGPASPQLNYKEEIDVDTSPTPNSL